ncbi:MAG TPA: HPP family protein [Acidobacteriaceae bacterium]
MPTFSHQHRSEHVYHLIGRLRLSWLLAHLPPRAVWATYVFFNSFITIALLTVLAIVSRNPFVFPSLGPTAYLFFFSPLGESATPRNAIYGHAIGLACGYFAYSVTGMHAFPQGFSGEVYWPRILASALALSLTGAVMVLLRVNHPPAGATTMIVSLGILSKPAYLPMIEIAVVLLAVQAFIINRLAGLPYPLWQSPPALDKKRITAT